MGENITIKWPYTHATKRAFDLLIALFLLFLSAPLLIIIAVFIKLDSSGPIFSKKCILGRNGIKIGQFRFRVMYTENHIPEIFTKGEMMYKLSYDPRLTKIGRWLRKTGLEELPQLINLLLGNMSFVGIRPISAVASNINDPQLSKLLKVKPGIIGKWRYQNFSLEESNIQDLLYVNSFGLIQDISIILDLIRSIFKAKILR